MSQIWMSAVARMNESCPSHTYESVGFPSYYVDSSTTAYCIWSVIYSQSRISISLVSFQRNLVKETWRTRSLIEIWESSHDTSNAIGCTSKEKKFHVSWATSLKENHTSYGTPKRVANYTCSFQDVCIAFCDDEQSSLVDIVLIFSTLLFSKRQCH